MKLVRSLVSAAIILFFTAGIACAVQIGPNPTDALLAGDGPFAVTSVTVSELSVSGFGGGTIFYPNTLGSYGVVVVAPGYTATNSEVMWFAKRLATHGFVTMAMNFYSMLDLVEWRATQMRSADKYMTSSSPLAVRIRIDTSRRALSGHSMGGGATLDATQQDSTFKAGIPLTPFSIVVNDFSSMKVPQMIIGADNDTTAPVATYAYPFYTSIPNTTDKAYALLTNATHATPTSTDARVGRYGVAWAKRFVDGDTRYSPFLCGADATAYNTTPNVDKYLSNCPY